MTFLVLFIVFLLVVVLPRTLSRRRAKLITQGLPARGLVLRAASTGTVSMVGGQRFQVRNVTLDVEVMGRPPYEISLSASFPRLCESFPGTALDLRIDPANPNNVTIVGPAGSTAWIGAASSLLPQAAGVPSQTASGCGTVVVWVIGVILAGASVLSFIAGAGSSNEKSSTEVTPAETPEAPTVARPAEEPASATHAECEAAERCCKTLSHPKCTGYRTMSEAACKAALKDETKAAAKVGKTCK